MLGRPQEGFDPGSWWDVISGTCERLQADRPGEVTRLESGRLRYGVDHGATAAAPAGVRAPAAVPAWALTRPPADPTQRPVAPSRTEGAPRVPAPSPLAVAAGPGAPLGRFRRGDLIHRLLERLPEIPVDARRMAAGRLLSRERDLDEAQRSEMIEAAFAVLEDERFAPVFGPGSRAEVAIAGRFEDAPVSGRIDRLVVTPERVLVVDYKTNRPAPDRAEDAD